jgi:hypothetical protein
MFSTVGTQTNRAMTPSSKVAHFQKHKIRHLYDKTKALKLGRLSVVRSAFAVRAPRQVWLGVLLQPSGEEELQLLDQGVLH